MNPARGKDGRETRRAATPLDPALLRIIEAMARDDAQRDFERAMAAQSAAAPLPSA